MKEFAKTKIVATIGPSSWDENILREMISEGMDVARINASFADFEELERVSTLIREISPRVAIMLDTKGHKIRVTGFKEERILKKNSDVIIVPENFSDNISDRHIAITYPSLHNEISRNTHILLDDGNIVLEVDDIRDNQILCKVVQEGILKPGKTVNIPATRLHFPPISEKDKADIRFAVDNNFDFISASFIRSAQDVSNIREIMGDTETRLIAKIENQEGIDNFDEILSLVDGVMIARGDMGGELPLEDVPIHQKQMIYKCRNVGKPVIVATQMLESMRENSRPTRAEVSDVANAVMDGTDAVMLSAETSTGKFPVEAIKMMNKIALRAENILRPQKVLGNTDASIETDEVCRSVFDMTQNLILKGVIVISESGKTVRSLARHRLSIPIWEISDNIRHVRCSNLLRGVKTYYINSIPKDRDRSVIQSTETIYSYGELDLSDKIAIISGSSITNRSKNTILEIVEVKDIIG
jgi:pyruvate kinase